MRNTEALRHAAEAANVAKTEFLATMSHELRTPLSGVLGTAELLTLTSLSDAQRGLVDTLGRSGRALLEIIDEILDFARIESGAMRIERAPFDAGRLVGEVVDLFRAQAQTKGLVLELDEVSASPRWVLGDAGRVRQVLLNLVSNALKFTPRGRVSLHVENAGESKLGESLLRFAVRDTGIGITPALRDELFRPFVQADGSPARRFGGAGLGLAISQRLCELMGGRIGVDAAPGGGSVFWFELPLPVVGERVAPHASIAPPTLTVADDGAVRVLLVEDNEVNALVIQAQLTQLGCRCDVANGGEQALQRLERERYDLVFMDCMMPGIDGYEVTRRVRARELARSGVAHLPIVALTANVDADSARLSRGAGMDDHMSKPCSIEGLAAAIQRWALRPAAAGPSDDERLNARA
jgi:CheY-like chemotaxis protein